MNIRRITDKALGFDDGKAGHGFFRHRSLLVLIDPGIDIVLLAALGGSTFFTAFSL